MYLKNLSLGKNSHNYLCSKIVAFDRHLYDVRATICPYFSGVLSLIFFLLPFGYVWLEFKISDVCSQFSDDLQTRGFNWVSRSLLLRKKWLLQVYKSTWLYRIACL